MTVSSFTAKNIFILKKGNFVILVISKLHITVIDYPYTQGFAYYTIKNQVNVKN